MTGSNLNLTFDITAEDLISSGLCALTAYYYKRSAFSGAAEQLGSIVVAKNISNNTSVLDRSDSDVLIQEYDMWTSASRGIYSAVSKRANERIAMDAIAGGVSNIVARYLGAYVNLSVPKL